METAAAMAPTALSMIGSAIGGSSGGGDPQGYTAAGSNTSTEYTNYAVPAAYQPAADFGTSVAQRSGGFAEQVGVNPYNWAIGDYTKQYNDANAAQAALQNRAWDVQGRADQNYPGMQAAAQAVYNTAFDPQNELRAREEQRLAEAVRSGLAARGLNTSAAGQGIENRALTDFGLDWQNQQLQRQIGGAGAYGGLLGQGIEQMANARTLGTNMLATGQNIANTSMDTRVRAEAALAAARAQGLNAFTNWMRGGTDAMSAGVVPVSTTSTGTSSMTDPRMYQQAVSGAAGGGAALGSNLAGLGQGIFDANPDWFSSGDDIFNSGWSGLKNIQY